MQPVKMTNKVVANFTYNFNINFNIIIFLKTLLVPFFMSNFKHVYVVTVGK